MTPQEKVKELREVIEFVQSPPADRHDTPTEGKLFQATKVLLSCAESVLKVLEMEEEESKHSEDGQECGCEAYSYDCPCETFLEGSNQKLREVKAILTGGG